MNFEILKETKKPILLLGETGTGKSYLAKKIHTESSTRDSKFIHINIASLPEHLFESEVFGHVRGSFTGANSDREGFCEVVGNGCLFIDEIGELSISKQVKLLTLIDEGIYYPVGSSRPKKFKGRLIFATNRDILKMVKENTFREDLYYRIRFYTHELSPIRSLYNLREIIWGIINDSKIKYSRFNINFSEPLIDDLVSYDWPGNLRELKNTIEYFFELNQKDLNCCDIPNWISPCKGQVLLNSDIYKEALSLFEKRFLIKSLKLNSGKINKTALSTGINKVTLISKLKKYDIDRRQFINHEKRFVSGL